MAGGTEAPGLEETPTYSAAVTAFVFILVSLVVERGIHRLRKLLKRKHQKPLKKVLDKMTEELMLLGFISLLLTVLQSSVTKICVPKNFAKHMLWCSGSELAAPESSPVSNAGRRLLHYLNVRNVNGGHKRLFLAEEETGGESCAAKGKVAFTSLEVLHQLHIFIFVLAVTHVFYCLLTVGLGFAKLHNWQAWERETRVDGFDGKQDLERRFCKIIEYQNPASPNPFVGKPHANIVSFKNPVTLWTVCFLRQFFAPISQEDYLVFRLAFLTKHGLPNSFNFRDYVIRSMEVDFKKVIGISWWLWLVVILFLLLDVDGWYTYFWAAFIPTIIVLVMGTKQQHIIATLTHQAKIHAGNVMATKHDPESSQKEHLAADIASTLSPSDNLFWFQNPKLLLRLLHFVIFQNSFELAVFFWFLTTFGWNSCILGNHTLLIIRIVAGLLTQLLASYSTLPIYALVTQMGSQMKETVFTKDVFVGIQGWQAKARRARDKNSSEEESSLSTGYANGQSAGSRDEGAESLQSKLDPPTVSQVENSNKVDPEIAKTFQSMYGKAMAPEKMKTSGLSKGSTDEEAGSMQSNVELPTVSQRQNSNDVPKVDPEIAKKFQSLYGKTVAIEKIKNLTGGPK